MNTPRVTVLMPVYNGEKYLSEAITSILNQTFTDFEFLIINDGSTDSSVSIIQSFKDDRIRLVNNEKNLGLITTLNKGIELANGEYIARMDCDDIALPQRLEMELDVFNTRPGIDVVATQILLINDRGYETGMWTTDTCVITSEEIRNQLPKACCIAHPSVIAKKALMKEYLYDLKQKGAEDWDLWLRMASDNRVFFKINKILLKYRVHSESTTIIRNQEGHYINSFKVQKRYCLNKIKRRRFNSFDFDVLWVSFCNYCNHILSLINSNIPVALSEIFRNDFFSMIGQFFKVLYLSANRDTSAFLFISYRETNEVNNKYLRFLKSVEGKKSLVFVTGKNGSGNMKGNIIDISIIGDFAFVHKWIKRKIAKLIEKSKDPIVVGYNSVFFYNLIEYLGERITCVDVIENNINLIGTSDELVYNYGIWAMPYTERLAKRIVVGKETFEELKDMYIKHKAKHALLDKMEYVTDISSFREKINANSI